MKLYTAGSTRQNRADCVSLGVGLLMVDGWRDPSEYPYFAVDNGAFSAWKRGARWDPCPFLRILGRCIDEGRRPDFAVLPDIVGGGAGSLAHSRRWLAVLDEAFPGTPWALAVQDGMDEAQVADALRAMPQVRALFVGGTMGWKLATMRGWASLAHASGLACHVGRIGTVDRMLAAREAGVDSIDSTTWVQNKGCLRSHVGAYLQATAGPFNIPGDDGPAGGA